MSEVENKKRDGDFFLDVFSRVFCACFLPPQKSSTTIVTRDRGREQLTFNGEASSDFSPAVKERARLGGLVGGALGFKR